MTATTSLWTKLVEVRRKHANLKRIGSDFETVVEDYVQSSIQDVEQRFALISADVERFFGILEQSAPELASPALKLLSEHDRGVMLEVEFRGEKITPAYKYLSESQLNSFGLAVFLASARRFNPDFGFLLLDDVINSFDGYKRPLVIKLLKEEFLEHQVLLLTHDGTWRDRLFEEFSQWVRLRFTGFSAIGPVLSEGRSEMEKIEAYLRDDEPVQAGRTMGPFLERQLQDLCEAFEVYVPYNRRNEYTLKPLLERFAVRVKDKLKSSHALYAATSELQEESGFRNLTAHAKDPAVELTTVEMEIVVTKWKAVASLVKCAEQGCYGFLKYDSNGGFVCNCGATRLTKN